MKPMKEWSDGQLIQAYKQGVIQAANEIVLRHYPRILMLCCRRLRSNEDGKDAAQTVFFKVIVEKKIFEFRGQARLSTWLVRIAINACNSQYNRNRRHILNLSHYPKAKLAEETVLCSSPNPEECYTRNEEISHLNASINRLPPKYRQALCSTYLENRSYREAAQQLGIPITALAVQILRGKKMLGMLLANHPAGTRLDSFRFKSWSLAAADA